MTITKFENGWMRDDFIIGESPLVYRDALVMLTEDYNKLTEGEIAELKQKRYDDWLYRLNRPPEPVEMVNSVSNLE